MAWKKVLGNITDEKEKEVPDPEKKLDEKAKEPEKSPAELIAESLKPFTERFDAIQAELESLKVKTTPKADKHEVPSVMDDENEAFNARLTPIMAKTFEIEAKGNLRDVEFQYRKAGYGDLWDENRKEIESEIGNTNLVTTVVNKEGNQEVVPLRGNPKYIENVVDMIFGRAMKKGGVRYGKSEEGKKGEFFLEDATGDETVITRKEKATDGITKSQLRAAERFGIPISDYKKSAAKLKFVDRGEKVERSA